MKYLIVENERYAAEQLRDIVSSLRPDWELVATKATVKSTVEFFEEGGEVDLCFFDIELNDGDCFEIFMEIDMKAPVVLTTAYSDFLLKAFKVYSVDYLLKPILTDDVRKAIEKFEKYFRKPDAVEIEAESSASGPEDKIPTGEVYAQLARYLAGAGTSGGASIVSRVLTVSGDNYGYLNIEDVAWFLSEDKFIFAVDLAGRRRMTSFTKLSDVQAAFGENTFFQVQRNVICSVAAVKGVSKYFKGRLKVTLGAGTEKLEVLVSAERRQAFLAWLGA